MKKILIISAVITAAFALYMSGMFGKKITVVDVEHKITQASNHMLGEFRNAESYKKELEKGFHALLDAMVMALPKAKLDDKIDGRIIAAGKRMKEKGIMDPQSAQMLREAFRDMNRGEEFAMPGSIKNVNDAVAYGKELLVNARDYMKTGKPGKAVKTLLEFANVVLTPVKKVAH